MSKGICPMLSGVDLDGKLIKVECITHECMKYVHIIGKDPQTGQDVNQWDCADTWMPILMIENSKQQLGTSAAIESLRNEVVNMPPQLMLRNK